MHTCTCEGKEMGRTVSSFSATLARVRSAGKPAGIHDRSGARRSPWVVLEDIEWLWSWWLVAIGVVAVVA